MLRRFRAQSGGAADFIVRLGWNALQLTNPAGRPFALVDYLQCLPPDRNPHEVNLRASVGRDEPALAVRLILPLMKLWLDQVSDDGTQTETVQTAMIRISR